MTQSELPRGLATTNPVYHQSNIEGYLHPWEFLTHSKSPFEIQQEKLVGVWISAQPADSLQNLDNEPPPIIML